MTAAMHQWLRGVPSASGFNEVDDFGYAEGNLRYFNAREDGLRLGASGRRIVALHR